MFISRKSSYREVDVDDFVKEASALSVTMLKLRGQCPTKIQNSLEFSIGRWFEAYSLYYKISRPVDLVQTWVKILREVHDSTAEVGLTPYSLMAYLKQQTTYKNCDPRLSKIIEQIISNIILEEICTKSHGPLHTAWDLIANGRELRARGIENLNDCNASLSQAITTLIANKDKVDGGPNCLLLAKAYGLLALCKHERKPTKEDYLQDIEKAADLWSSQKHDQFVKETQIASHNSFNLLYQFNDLLNLKDYKKDLHSYIYKLLIKSFNEDERLAMLWQSRSLGHALCASPLRALGMVNLTPR